MNNYILFTDGAYSSSRDTGGLAFAFVKNGKLIYDFSLSIKHTTNNKMELGAIIIGLRAIKKPIDSLTIVSDSQYCIGCAIKGWKRKKNIKLWEAFDKQYKITSKLCKFIEWAHTRGHQTDDSEFTKWNNYVDKLAVNETKKE